MNTSKIKLDIIFEDEDIIVVNKPYDTLSIPDRFNKNKIDLYTTVKEYCGEAFIVHRLDKDTSGIIIYAKNETAHRILSQDFENRNVTKIYWAVVDGTPEPQNGIIDKPIAHSETQAGKVVIHPRGKPSVTHYNTLKIYKKFSLVSCDIKTGRTHQIRIHLKSIGHPLAIDAFYGRRDELLLSEIKHKPYKFSKWQESELPLMKRTTLHAYSLRIAHPTTKEELYFESAPPKDFKALLQQLEKWGN